MLYNILKSIIEPSRKASTVYIVVVFSCIINIILSSYDQLMFMFHYGMLFGCLFMHYELKGPSWE